MPTPWCLSEFLNLIRVSDAAWASIALAPDLAQTIDGATAALYFVTQGSASVSFDDRTEQLASGDLLIALPGQSHVLENARPALGPCRIVRIALDIRWPGGFDDRFLRPAIKISANRNPIDIAALERSLHIPAFGVLLSRMASLALVSAIKNHPKSAQMLRSANDRGPIARAVQVMELHHRVPWTVDMLAQKVGMGRSSFAARFADETSKTPIEVLTEVRMNLAHRMLQQTHLKIAVIADRIGYRSEAAFNRRFAAHFGVTPGKIRSGGRPLS